MHNVKLVEMHMKRKVPQMYISTGSRDGKNQKLNDFNSVLKQTLLTPQRHRYVTTRREEADMDRASRKVDARELRSLDPPSSRKKNNEVLPIISVGSSVDF